MSHGSERTADQLELEQYGQAQGDQDHFGYVDEDHVNGPVQNIDGVEHAEVPVVRVFGDQEIHVENVEPVGAGGTVVVLDPDEHVVEHQRGERVDDKRQGADDRVRVGHPYGLAPAVVQPAPVPAPGRREPEPRHAQAVPDPAGAPDHGGRHVGHVREVKGGAERQRRRDRVRRPVVHAVQEHQSGHDDQVHRGNHDDRVTRVVTAVSRGARFQYLVQADGLGQRHVEHRPFGVRDNGRRGHSGRVPGEPFRFPDVSHRYRVLSFA